jgi:hypothetical protein
MAASLELRSVSEVFTLGTLGAAVSFSTKAWNVFRSGATHFKTKSISPSASERFCRFDFFGNGLGGVRGRD